MEKLIDIDHVTTAYGNNPQEIIFPDCQGNILQYGFIAVGSRHMIYVNQFLHQPMLSLYESVPYSNDNPAG